MGGYIKAYGSGMMNKLICILVLCLSLSIKALQLDNALANGDDDKIFSDAAQNQATRRDSIEDDGGKESLDDEDGDDEVRDGGRENEDRGSDEDEEGGHDVEHE